MKIDTNWYWCSKQALQWSSVIFVILAVKHDNMHSILMRFAWWCACVGWYQWEPNVEQFMLTVSFILYISDGSKKTGWRWILQGKSQGKECNGHLLYQLQYHKKNKEIQAALITAWGLRYRSLINVHFIFSTLSLRSKTHRLPWLTSLNRFNMQYVQAQKRAHKPYKSVSYSCIKGSQLKSLVGHGNTQLKTLKHTC